MTNPTRRYSAEEMNSMAEQLECGEHEHTVEKRAARLLRQAAETESRIPIFVSALRGAVDKLERLEVKVDGEWGLCRDIDELDQDGELSPELLAAREALSKFRGEDA